jgi:hypothetical protein
MGGTTTERKASSKFLEKLSREHKDPTDEVNAYAND